MQNKQNDNQSKKLPAASATADPTMAPIALSATAEAICGERKSLTEGLCLAAFLKSL